MNFKDTEQYINDTIHRQLGFYMFEPNDALTRISIIKCVETVLDGSGINDYLVICDSSNNPDPNSHTLTVNIGWQYKKDEGFIAQTFVLDMSSTLSVNTKQDLTKAFDRAMKGV